MLYEVITAFITNLIDNFIGRYLYGPDFPFFITGIVSGVAAIRIAAACKKMSVLSNLDAQLPATLRTVQNRGQANTFNTEHIFSS